MSLELLFGVTRRLICEETEASAALIDVHARSPATGFSCWSVAGKPFGGVPKRETPPSFGVTTSRTAVTPRPEPPRKTRPSTGRVSAEMLERRASRGAL